MPYVLTVSTAELEGIALTLGADQKVMVAAARSAATRAARWARVQVSRGLPARVGIPSDVLDMKKRTAVRSRAASAKLWIGLNPVGAIRGNPVQTASGVQAFGRQFSHAFVMRTRKGGRTVVRRRGGQRLPLDVMRADVEDGAAEYIDGTAWPGLNERFLALYRAELDKRGGR